MNATAWTRNVSPFHEGELAVQTRVGVRERLETSARMMIRDHLPVQHRQFYSMLPFLLVGSTDGEGRPWASVLVGEPGFVRSPDPKSLAVQARPLPGDPLAQGLRKGAPLGVLGLQPETRRRNRMAGHIEEIGAQGFTLGVDQAFGNCPQYIQTRTLSFVRGVDEASSIAPVRLTRLDGRARALIEGLDAFFVASVNPDRGDASARGADVSHRGGRPGFVRVSEDGRTLTVPEFPGNLHFNTLGNFLVDARAGILFVDFASGDLLTLTGSVEILWDDEEVEAFRGAERLWRFTLDHGFLLPDALPLRGVLGEWSPNTMLTGTWAEAEAARQVRALRDRWRPYRIVRTVRESSLVRSLYLEPADGLGLPSHEAGQYLPIRVATAEGGELIRTYTISSAPGEPYFRLSIKREERGGVSQACHDSVGEGDLVEAMAPRGSFVLDARETRPAVLISGGIGVTPMVAMARHVYREAIRTRHARPLWFINAARTSAERAFSAEVMDIAGALGGLMTVHFALDEPSDSDVPGEDYQSVGRVGVDLLKRLLPFDDYDFYLCGPGPMMQALYDGLRDLNVADERIHAESFGPASLKRRVEAPGPTAEPATAEVPVTFTGSGRTATWTPGSGTLLDLAEAQGLTPAYGCRVGACGTCSARLDGGEVAYTTQPAGRPEPGTVLLCCAVPAQTAGLPGVAVAV